MSSFLAALADHALLVCVGLLAAAALAVPARALLRRDPVTCYRLLFALLIGAVAVVPLQWLVAGRAAPLATPLRDWLRERSQGDALSDPDRVNPVPRDSHRSSEGIYLVDSELTPRRARDGSPAAAAAGALESKGRPAAIPACGADDASCDPSSPPPEAFLAGGLRLREERPLGRWIDALRDHRAELAAGAALLWLAGFAVVTGRRLLRVARTRRLIARASDVTDPDVVALWRRVVRGSRVADRIRLVESSAVASPACAGLVRRVVIVPAGARAPARGEASAAIAPGVLEWALRHELVHLERGDAWAALFQSAVTALLWFHPAAWWLSSEIGRLRELSCDRQVVEGSGRRKSYALALLEYAACASKHFPAIDADPHSAGVRHALLHWSRSPSQIRRRIEMLTVDPASLPRSRQWLGALVAGCAFAVPAIAQVAGAATLLPPRPAQEATPVAAPPTPPPARVELPSVPATPAFAPPAQADDRWPEPKPAPRARRRVTPPPGASAPAPLPEAKSLPPQEVAPEPALAPVRRPTKVRALGGDVDPEDLVEVEDADACCDGEDFVNDEAGRKIASSVEQKMRASHRQIEAAVRQAQRSSESHQRDLERELQKLDQQAQRLERQGAQKRESLQRRLADADGDDKKKIESELVELERLHRDQHDEVAARSTELERGLAALEDVNFDACRESLAALQEASAVDAREIERAVEAGLVAQHQAHASLQALGYVEGEGEGQQGEGAQAGARRKHVRDVHAAIERALAQSREATERACARAAEAVAHAQQRGALTPAQQEQVARALKQASKIDHDAIRAQVEKALAQAQDETKRNRVRVVKQPPADSAASAAPGLPRRPRAAKPPQELPENDPAPRGAPRAATPRAGGRPSSGHPSDAREDLLQDRIKMLEQQIDALRAELESLRQQALAAPPARHGRELR